jgi:hypothetical protein
MLFRSPEAWNPEEDADGGYPFEMEVGDELVFSIDASESLDVVIFDEEDAEAWSDGEVDEDEEEITSDRCRTDIYFSRAWPNARNAASRRRRMGLARWCLANGDDETSEVTTDMAVWAADE